ncbi:MAG: DUF192 domain-containing protein [Steroidobacteraceae bacterium]|nr:DUF192 domain-containing protein [Steroidobacteraceae bacterium]
MRHLHRLLPRSLEFLIAALLLGVTSAPAQIGPIEDLSAFPSAKLEIAGGKNAKHVFDVWLADTPARQAQGLMFVRSLPPARGMLFVHPAPRPISMWMRNTYIPLDMVFIDGRGCIQQIIANTKPHSLDLIRSNDPALAVLEIAGGEAQRLGLKPGQRVHHPALTRH